MIKKINQFKNNQGFMKYFKNTSWLFAEKILRMVIGLFVSIWVTRYLGPENFGIFSYAQSFVGIFSLIATLGIDDIVIRELVANPSKRDSLLGTAFRLKLIGSLILILILPVETSLERALRIKDTNAMMMTVNRIIPNTISIIVVSPKMP